MSAWTPGPWTVERGDLRSFDVIGGDGMTVAEQITSTFDARLIASAPELARALAAVLPFVETRWAEAAQDAVEMARAALKQAGAL